MKSECNTSTQENQLPTEELDAYIQEYIDSMVNAESTPEE